jgi:PAS domain-containing protein
MRTPDHTPGGRTALRSRADALLKGPGVKTDASTALGVLYQLASSPETAPDALSLLHELQVHQVEMDLQDEELRRARVELETSLSRQVQLYDHAPFGLFALDERGVLRELNLTGAALLGFERDFLRGRPLEGFLTAAGLSALRTMRARIAAGAPTAYADLHLRGANDAAVRCLHASACPDPAGSGTLIGMMGIGATPAIPGA